MSKFTYMAVDEKGSTVSGVEAGASKGSVNAALRQRGLEPIEVAEKTSVLQFEITKKRVPRKELMHFSRQLAVFIKAGIPILDGLEIIREETTKKLFAKALDGMIGRLQAGDTFAVAAAAHPEAFPDYYVGILASAELTGNLDVVLDQLAEYIEREIDSRQKVKAAITYPLIVMVMAIGVVIVLAGYVLPKFKTFFESLHAKLPLPTRMLLGLTNFLLAWWFLFAAAAVAVFVIAIVMRKTTGGRARFDAIVLKVPLIGSLLVHAIVERVCRLLSAMLRAGVPLPQAMTVTADATNNAVYRRGLGVARGEMLEGKGLAAPLARTGLFPGAARQMLRVGEDTGTLDQQLETAADFYERELAYRMKRFLDLMEPVVIVFVGAIVGFVAIALISAMYGIYHQVKV